MPPRPCAGPLRVGSAKGPVAVTADPDLPRPDAGSRSALTYYGELVRRQWQGCLPDAYQQIRDPGAFFAVLGEVIAQRIDELADYLAVDDPPGLRATGSLVSRSARPVLRLWR